MAMTTELKPVPKPVKEGRGTRAAIIAAAARIMHVKGYTATSLDDVLRESAVGKGNFYYYFKSKEDLGYEILDRAIRSFLERTLDPCFADPDANRLGQVRCFVDRVLEVERERNCVGGCLIGPGARGGVAGLRSGGRGALPRGLAGGCHADDEGEEGHLGDGTVRGRDEALPVAVR
jgi:AcrR family transcriptional regulator